MRRYLRHSQCWWLLADATVRSSFVPHPPPVEDNPRNVPSARGNSSHLSQCHSISVQGPSILDQAFPSLAGLLNFSTEPLHFLPWLFISELAPHFTPCPTSQTAPPLFFNALIADHALHILTVPLNFLLGLSISDHTPTFLTQSPICNCPTVSVPPDF